MSENVNGAVMTEAGYEKLHDLYRDTVKEFKDTLLQMQTAYKNDASTSTPNAGQFHGINPNGTYGLFTTPGVNPRMFQTIVQARGDLHRLIPMQKTIFLQVRREIVTGITDSTGQTPSTGFCAVPPTPGDPKICRFDQEFGEIHAKTKTNLLTNVGSRYNLSDVDREIIINEDIDPFVPDPVKAARTNQNSQLYHDLLTLGHDIRLQVGRVDFRGTQGASSSAYPFFQRQYAGLDSLVKTGYVDVVTGQACGALDSRIETFGANITTTAADGRTIVDYVTDMWTGITLDLESMGYDMNNTMFGLVLNKRMWRPLTRQWVCAYFTTGCTVRDADGQRVVVNAEMQRRIQDEMYNGRYLMLDGIQMPVFLVDGDTQTFDPNTGIYTSSIYILPIRVNGIPTLYYEFFDMGNTELMQKLDAVGDGSSFSSVYNGGLYLVHRMQTAACLEFWFQAKVRLLLDAPFAAGRIDSVSYADTTRQRDAYPSTSYYFNGGVTQRATIG